MNNIILITSAINIKKESPAFIHSNTRSYFNFEERFRQTIYTICNIKIFFPDSQIYLVDCSEISENNKKILDQFSNLKILKMQDLCPDKAKICQTSKSLGLTESIITDFFNQYIIDNDIKFDFLLKISGRYFFTSFNSSILNQENIDKFLIKPVLRFEWQNKWNFIEEFNKNGFLNYCCSRTYCIGVKKFIDFKNGIKKIVNFYETNSCYYIDYEVLIHDYIFMNTNYVEVPWITAGFKGVSGEFQSW